MHRIILTLGISLWLSGCSIVLKPATKSSMYECKLDIDSTDIEDSGERLYFIVIDCRHY